MKKTICFSGFAVFIIISSLGQGASVEWEEKIYKRVDGKELLVDIFYASGKKANKIPAIAFFHGGGWVFGSRAEFHEACKRYARKGFVTFSFEYRLSIQDDGTYPHPGRIGKRCQIGN